MTTPDDATAACPVRPPVSFADGRDELNLADFPISVLQRQQPQDADGRKLDQVVYESTTYDPVARRRLPQRVTLTTSSRYGLPTPADENVVLALLYTARRASGFAEPRVHFSPHQLFQVMKWASNSRSYTRLGQVLLRLKSLTLLYENAWWDHSGRRYEVEFATGIVAEYLLVKSRVRRKADDPPPSYVHWSPRFHKSLSVGNLKKLDLDLLFSLALPTSQRMYRFLDKRFYLSPTVELDLREFAFGHLGVTVTPNVAELKRRIAPAIAELESVGFLEPAPAADRFLKVKRGIWRVRFRKAGSPAPASPADGPSAPTEARAQAPPTVPAAAGPPGALVAAFYRAWTPGRRTGPTAQELSQAAELIESHGADGALALVGPVTDLLRAKFPDARRFGASLPYFGEAARSNRGRARRQSADDEAALRRRSDRERADRERAEDDAFFDEWLPAWEALPGPARDEVVAGVLREHPYLARPLLRGSRVATRMYLDAFARRSGAEA